MRKWLKIENPGKCPVEGFTLLGATSKRNSNLIGFFGSGCKMSIALLLRAGIQPIVFCSNHKLEFGTKQGQMLALEGETIYSRMVVKHGGKEDDGTSVTYTEDLSQTDQYGVADWTELGMALREFVSNALDATVTYNSINFIATMYPWDGVKIELVDENQVRAKKDSTRVFIPADNEDVIRFLANLGKWFLHFSEPELIYRGAGAAINPILEKSNRNFNDKHTSVIYRRGVRVREISGWVNESLFDYNLDDLRVDESRNVDDYACQAAASRAIGNADVRSLTKLLSSFMSENIYWEHCFSQYDMRSSYGETNEILKDKETRWATALENLGENTVLVQKDGAATDTLIRKGYKPVKVPEAFVHLGDAMKIRTPSRVLSEDDRSGRQVIPANDSVIAAVDWAWDKISLVGMTRNMEKPPVHCFICLMDGAVVCDGFYRNGEVYLNQDISSGESINIRKVALEELAHYITGSTDNSRDFQQFAFDFAVRVAMVDEI
jgi:hypothetical protein